jgi:type VI secretion system protein ImpE
MSLEVAERAVREGDLQLALQNLQEQIRSRPADAELRVFLFQLLCVLGQWERAQAQLKVAADLDAKGLAMAQMYREAIRCEMFRSEVFAGKKSPVVFGAPDQWIALLIESLVSAPDATQSRTLRAQAFEAAPTSSGSINGERFEWIADADMRLGPVCEAVINGQYYWVPFERLSRIELEPPADLRDVVWMPAHFQFANGGETVGVIPTRYPGSEGSDDAQICLGRKTHWVEGPPEVFSGLGQRVLTTDSGDHALMDIRTILIGDAATDQAQPTTYA